MSDLKNKPLLPKHQLFAKEYIIDLNAKQAAIRAGYSPKTATEQGARLLTYVNVQLEIQRLMDERSKRTEITADDVLRELAKIGMADMNDYIIVTDEGVVQMRPLETLPEGASRIIKKIKQKTITLASKEDKQVLQTTTEFELHGKVEALQLVGKHLGMFKEKVELSGPDGGAVQVHAYIPDNGR